MFGVTYKRRREELLGVAALAPATRKNVKIVLIFTIISKGLKYATGTFVMFGVVQGSELTKSENSGKIFVRTMPPFYLEKW